MRIGVLIPTRGDRPELLNNCLRMLKAQTLQPEVIEIVNYAPESDNIDITQRYKRGYDALRNKGLDIIALIEDDDWYSHEYLETMVNYWIKEGKPTLLGLNHTIYYHIGIFEHFTMHHTQRSSAMNTLITPDIDFDWGKDENPYADVHIWNILKGKIVTPEKEICLGIKHGIGKCGGQNHTDKMGRFINKDHDKAFLKSIMTENSFEFYSNYIKQFS